MEVNELTYNENIVYRGDMGVLEKQVTIGINLFRMGPARSLLILAYLFPWMWVCGCLYVVSSIHEPIEIEILLTC